MKGGEKPIASPFVRLREEFDDWAILFDCDTGHGFGLSPTGVYLFWKLLDGEHSIEALSEEIRGHAEDVPVEAGDHIGAFVDALVAEGLAGFDSSGLGPDTAGRPQKAFPPGYVSEVTPFNYEPPKLVDFRDPRTAQGNYTPGSGDSGTCNSGHAAGRAGTAVQTLLAALPGAARNMGQVTHALVGVTPTPAWVGLVPVMSIAGREATWGAEQEVAWGLGSYALPGVAVLLHVS